MFAAPQPRSRLYTSVARYQRILREITTGRFARGDGDVTGFEAAVCRYIGVKHAIAMPMARTGIYFAVKALIKHGQKVVMSPYTIADVVNMVLCAGGVPVFADLDRDTCNISADEVARLIDADTGAVLVTHFYGLACDIERISKACRDRGVPLIEDSAQAFGTTVGGKRAGSYGDLAVFSFGMYKNVNAFFGGMVVSDNEKLIEGIRSQLADAPTESVVRYAKKLLSGVVTDILTFPPFFKLFSFWFFRWAYLNRIGFVNRRLAIDTDPRAISRIPADYVCRLSPMQARIALAQLGNVDAGNRARIAAARRYFEGLNDIPELVLPPMRDNGSHIYTYFCIQYAPREELVRYLQRKRRDVAESYHRNCAALPCFAPYGRDCANARLTADSLIYLPTYPRYPHSEIEANIRAIREFFGKQP